MQCLEPISAQSMTFISFILTLSKDFCDLWAENDKNFITLNSIDAISLIEEQVGRLALINLVDHNHNSIEEINPHSSQHFCRRN